MVIKVRNNSKSMAGVIEANAWDKPSKWAAAKSGRIHVYDVSIYLVILHESFLLVYYYSHYVNAINILD